MPLGTCVYVHVSTDGIVLLPRPHASILGLCHERPKRETCHLLFTCEYMYVFVFYPATIYIVIKF